MSSVATGRSAVNADPANVQPAPTDAHPLASLKTPKATYLALLARGYWPVAIRPDKKSPIGKAWGLERGDVDTAYTLYKSNPRAGVGVCLGPGRGPGQTWLIDLEGDGPAAEDSRRKLLGQVETLGWDSTRGGHQLLTADGERLGAIVAKLKKYQVKEACQPGVFHIPALPDLELRIGGYKEDGTVKQLQSVVPPTPGTDGVPRAWNGVEAVAEAPESFYVGLEAIVATADEGRPVGVPPGLADEIERERGQAEASAPPPKGKKKTKGMVSTNEGWTPEQRAIAYLKKCDPAISKQGGHNQAFKVACNVGPGFDLPPEVFFRMLWTEYNPRCKPPWSEPELRHKVEDAYKDPKNISRGFGWLLLAEPDKPSANGDGHHTGNGKPTEAHDEQPDQAVEAMTADERVPIEVTTRRDLVVQQSIQALARDPDLFYRGEMLVTVAGKDDADGPKAGSPRIVALVEAVIGCYLTRNASFYEMRTDRHGEPYALDVHPPEWLIKAVAHYKYWPRIRPLLAVVECPYPRPDGSVVEAPGYDPATGTVYRPAITFPRVPDRPTREEAQAAWERLKRPFRQFPFRSEEDRSVVLAGLLTGIARPAIDGPVPGIAVNGNKASCGKAMIVDAIGNLVYGHNVPTSGYPTEAEEAHKVKIAIAVSGKPLVHFDNLEEGSTYGNAGIDSALTSSIVEDRILGTSRNTGEIVMRTTWFLTGNNLSPAKDAYRRWLPSNLVSDLERPEERNDLEIEDLRAHMLEHRGRYVRDALVILKAHALAGRPRGDWGPLGSFEKWDRVVRGAVWYATGLDCCSTLRKAAEDSPDRLNKLALLEGWRELPGGKDGENGVTAARAVEMVAESPAKYETLRNAFMVFGRDGKPATAKIVGNRLRAIRGNIIGGMKFVESGSEHRAIRWKVVSGESGESGESDFPPSHASSRFDNYVNMNGGTRNPPEEGAKSDSPDSPDSPTSGRHEASWEELSQQRWGPAAEETNGASMPKGTDKTDETPPGHQDRPSPEIPCPPC